MFGEEGNTDSVLGGIMPSSSRAEKLGGNRRNAPNHASLQLSHIAPSHHLTLL